MKNRLRLLGVGYVVVVPRAELTAFARDVSAELPGPGAFQLVPPGDRPFYCLTRFMDPRGNLGLAPAGIDWCAGETWE